MPSPSCIQLSHFPPMLVSLRSVFSVKIKNRNIKYIESGDWKEHPHSLRQPPINRKKGAPFSFPAETQPITSHRLCSLNLPSFLSPYEHFLLPSLCREVNETSCGYRSWIVILCRPWINLFLLENISEPICFRLIFPSSFVCLSFYLSLAPLLKAPDAAASRDLPCPWAMLMSCALSNVEFKAWVQAQFKSYNEKFCQI